MKLTRRPCVSLTHPRKLQFHWKGSADATYQSFAAATVTVRHHESKITRNQGCFSRYMKNVALRIADRLQFFLSAATSRDFIAFSFFFFFFFFGYRRERYARKTKFERRERANDCMVARRKNRMEIIPMPVLTMRAFSVLYAVDL